MDIGFDLELQRVLDPLHSADRIFYDLCLLPLVIKPQVRLAGLTILVEVDDEWHWARMSCEK